MDSWVGHATGASMSRCVPAQGNGCADHYALQTGTRHARAARDSDHFRHNVIVGVIGKADTAGVSDARLRDDLKGEAAGGRDPAYSA